MIFFPIESRLEVDIKTAIDQFKPGFPPSSKSRRWTQRRWEWLMDAVADEQPTQNESTEDWMRNERMEGGVGYRSSRKGGSGWSSEG